MSSGGTASAAVVLSGGLQFIAANGTATGTGTALFDPLADAVTIDENGTLYTQQLSGDYTGDQFNLAQASDASTLLTVTAACYCAGTLILTDRDEVAVERLAIGDTVITAAGEHRPSSGSAAAATPAASCCRTRTLNPFASAPAHSGTAYHAATCWSRPSMQWSSMGF